MKTQDLAVGQRIVGAHSSGPVAIIKVDILPGGFANLIVLLGDGTPLPLMLSDEMQFELDSQATYGFEANPDHFKLALEAKRMELAGVFDPFVAVSTSNLQALPHQLSAVYGELLERMPLRFLLADEPGAGKTIMAGLLIKELLLRGYLKRCLIVCPGSLSDQWAAELKDKFGLSFRQVTKEQLDAAEHVNPFLQGGLFIARMDQLARANKFVQEKLDESDWDLVIVDEAHRMSAQQGGFMGDSKRTKRFTLGQRLSKRATHLLLMTATPHAGSDENFHLFLSLLDEDVFAGNFRAGQTKANLESLMLRRVKENLVDIDGAKLFPKRKALSASYELSPLELELYEVVTEYVRIEMAKAMATLSGDKKKQGNVSFALTVLQRRLASSPEAILNSLTRRLEKLQAFVTAGGSNAAPSVDLAAEAEDEELSEAELEDVFEVGEIDGVTVSTNIDELNTEISKLKDLVQLAQKVKDSGTDSKWNELRGILESDSFVNQETNEYEKLIIFTEHRDTLNYLVKNISAVLRPGANVIAIHGGNSRSERQKSQAEFTNNPDCPILVATDAAGEGINLQRAHLMVNYDLPWNPNRIEQRFGRIHRIGQKFECTLWNLVSSNTREGKVYSRLLEKIQIQDEAYGGQLFHVLGGDDLFEGRSLSDLIQEAILAPEEVTKPVLAIDEALAKAQLLAARKNALVPEVGSTLNVDEIVEEMNAAKSRRLAPGFVAHFFLSAFKSLGGEVIEREQGRYKIPSVPMALQKFASTDIGLNEIASKYERVTFNPLSVEVENGPEAELVVPGTPLMTATVKFVLSKHGESLVQGATLYGAQNELGTKPRLLVCLKQDFVNSFDQGSPLDTVVSFVEVDFDGEISLMNNPPYLDYDPMPTDAAIAARAEILSDVKVDDLVISAKESFRNKNIEERFASLSAKVNNRVERLSLEVSKRLDQEAKYWKNEATNIAQGGKSSHGLTAAQAIQRHQEIKQRKEKRLAQLKMERVVLPKAPEIVSVALIVPPAAKDQSGKLLTPKDQEAIKRVERRAVDLTLRTESILGFDPTEMPRNNPGYDIESERQGLGKVFIEVKGRIDGAKEFLVTDNEYTHGITQGESFFLALVKVASGDDATQDEIRYIQNPFAGMAKQGGYVAHILSFDHYWEQGFDPREVPPT